MEGAVSKKAKLVTLTEVSAYCSKSGTPKSGGEDTIQGLLRMFAARRAGERERS